MALIRMNIQTVVAGNGPLASLIVLSPCSNDGDGTVRLPIRIGNIEAAAISMGIGNKANTRPMTHDLLATTIRQLGGSLTGVAIVGAHGTTFFAQLLLTTADGSNISVDCRPSDAIALAVRMHVPIFADEFVLHTASMPDFKLVESDATAADLERFHDFIEGLTPADFE